jgi:hypothetical protein
MFLITGMHRSGTSCVTGLLHKCGLSLGTSFEISRAPFPHNTKGHFENMGLLRNNDAILQEAQGSWQKPPKRSDVTKCAAIKKIRQFNDLFDGDIAKDPRSTILIDFYIQNCPSMKKIVHCFRHPLAVVDSLYRRNKFSEKFSLSLWLYYNEYFLHHISNYPVIFVNYEKLLSDVEPQTQRILNFLGPGKMSSDVLNFVDKNLNHFNEEQKHNTICDREAADLYNKLLDKSLAPY